MKSIVVMPVKNEDWILEKTLKALSLWVDHIIIADQNSTDNTLEITKKFEKVSVITNNATFHSSAVRKLLLDEARRIDSGNNIIFSFDADEIPTSEILEQIDTIKKTCKPGESFEFQWLNLWKSVTEYRNDSSMFSNSWKVFGFVDDRELDYTHTNVVNDHTSRVPFLSLQKIHRFETPKVLHYQFSNWDRTLSKQCYYRTIDFLHQKSFINTIKVNHRYFATRNESNVKLKKITPEMFNIYRENGIHIEEITSNDLHWTDVSILKDLKKYGTEYFSLLDIWYIDWEKKRLLAKEANILNIPEEKIRDPRNFLIKFYHTYLQKPIDYGGLWYTLYTKLKIN